MPERVEKWFRWNVKTKDGIFKFSVDERCRGNTQDPAFVSDLFGNLIRMKLEPHSVARDQSLFQIFNNSAGECVMSIPPNRDKGTGGEEPVAGHVTAASVNSGDVAQSPRQGAYSSVKNVSQDFERLSPFGKQHKDSPPNKRLSLSPSQLFGTACKPCTVPAKDLQKLISQDIPVLSVGEDDLGCSSIDWPKENEEMIQPIKVTIAQIPQPFLQGYLLKFIEKKIRNNEKYADLKLDLTCSPFNSKDCSVVVEFPCREVADEFLNHKPINFGNSILECAYADALQSPPKDSMKTKDEAKSSTLETVVEVRNLPANLPPLQIFEAYFVYKINQALLGSAKVSTGESSVDFCYDYNEETSSVFVKFKSAELAAKACSLQNFMYEKSKLQFRCDILLTRMVEMTNLPDIPFFKDYFKFILEDALKRQPLNMNMNDVVLEVHDFDKAKNSVMVEFISSVVAEEICSKLETFLFEGSAVQLKQITEITSFSKEEQLPPEPLASVHVTEQLSPEVVVSNIPGPLFKDYFLYIIKTAIAENKDILCPEEALVTCSEYSQEEQCVTLTFDSSKTATKFCSPLNPILYRESRLILKQKSTVGTTCQPPLYNYETVTASKPVEPPQPCSVLVKNVIEPFDNDEFVQLLLSKMWYTGTVSNEENPILKCSKLKDRCQVTLEINSRKTALAVAGYTDVEYNRQRLSFTLLCSADTTHSVGVISPVSTITSIEKDDGEFQFVMGLLRLRHLFLPGKNHDSGLARLEMDLRKQFGVVTTIAEMKSKRGRMLEKYRREKKKTSTDWMYQLPMAVLNKDASADQLEETIFSLAEDVSSHMDVQSSSANASLEKYTKGRVWATAAIKAVIAICYLNKDEYDKPVRHTQFWKNVSDILKDQYQHCYTAEQCEALMAKNVRIFKNEVQRLGQSGAEGPTVSPWPFFEDMIPLMEGNVSVWPTLTASGGTSYRLAVAVPGSGAAGTVLKKQDDDERTVKSRPYALNRPVSASEKKMSGVVGALNESNDLKRELIGIMKQRYSN